MLLVTNYALLCKLCMYVVLCFQLSSSAVLHDRRPVREGFAIIPLHFQPLPHPRHSEDKVEAYCPKMISRVDEDCKATRTSNEESRITFLVRERCMHHMSGQGPDVVCRDAFRALTFGHVSCMYYIATWWWNLASIALT